jgi:adenylate cyclase
MTTKGFKRKLSAILSADVKGYSRLMQDDEEATVRTITAYREVMTDRIKGHDGRVADAKGDNVLAEFGSVVDAVRCAVEIQKELKLRNAELPERRRMEFRISINLGDVIEEGEIIYGDGVNIAARLESLSEAGGVCISGTAFDQIGKKLALGYEFLGEQTVKNIEKPVRAYKVLMEPEHAGKVIGEERPKPKHWRWAAIGGVVVLIIVAGILAVWHHYIRPQFEPASVERMAFPLPEKPSIAVLPFVNMTGDPAREYIADGLSENIITALSNISEMFVIARNSTFTYKGKPVKIQHVSEELGVRYVLEGSVQKSGNRLRISGQLIDASTGHHLWAKRYDRDLNDLFDLLDEITKEIVVALQVQLTEGEQARIWHDTDNLEAWSYVVNASTLFEQYTRENNARAQQLFKLAVKLDPEYAFAWTMLAWTYWAEARFGWSESGVESIKRSVEIAQKAIALNETLPEVHSLWSNIHLIQGRYEKAIAEGKKAIALGPNNATCHVLLAYTMTSVGKFEEAIVLGEKAIRLSPYCSPWYLLILEDAYRMTGRYEEALAMGKQYLERCRKGECNLLPAHIGLAATYIGLGRVEEARTHAAEVLRMNPNFSLDEARKMSSFKDPVHLERVLDALRKAGIPETLPLPLPDKPSIAVLPFVNMSGDPKQEYFSDGITEEIITALSKTPKLFVIARNSTFTYKGKPTKVQQVGRDLGVRYVLEGSVRKAGNKVRVTAQLVDAGSGQHLWAERYDRDLKDIFAIQDEITLEIIKTMQVVLVEGEQARITAKGTKNLDAYLLCLQGAEQLRRWNKDGLVRGRKMVEKAIALDPKYAEAHCLLAWSYWFEVPLVLTRDPRQSIARAMELAQKALALDKSLAYAHSLMGFMYILQRQYVEGIAECEQAVSLEPNSARAHYFLGLVMKYAGRHKEAITVCKEAIRLNPIPPSLYYIDLINLYCLTGQYEEAITAGKKAVHLGPNNLIAHAFLTAAYSLRGLKEEARIEAGEVLRINPKFSIDRWTRNMPYKNEADKELIISALHKAGLK